MKRGILVLSLLAAVLVIPLAKGGGSSDTIVIKGLEKLYGPVEFSHGDHEELAEDCSSCHHHSDEPLACGECHEPISVYHYKGKERKAGIGLKGAYHGLCIGCHKENESGPVGCTDCHAKKAGK